MRRKTRAVRELATRLIAARVPIALCVCAVSVFFAWRACHLTMAVRTADLGPRDHPFLASSERFASATGGDDLVVVIEASDGSLFTPERLAQVFEITRAVDSIPGLNHDRVDSIAHRTARVLEATAGSALRSAPLMPIAPRTEAEAQRVRRAVRKAEHLYGVLVSRDERAALVRAHFGHGGAEYRRILDDLESRVLVPQRDGWIGALLSESRDGRVRVDHVFPEGAAAEAGLREGDLVAKVNAQPVTSAQEIAEAVAAAAGAGVEIGFERDHKPESVTLIGGGSRLRVSVAGQAALNGWIHRLATRTYAVFAAAALCAGALVFLYFHDRRAVLRPAVTAALAAIWSLGLLELTGVGLDPLALVAPFFLTARAFVHGTQSHERYYEECAKGVGSKRDAVIATYAALFAPAVGAMSVDAAIALAMTLVPIVFVQKLAITAAFWIAAMAVAELVASPILLDGLRAPDSEALERRSEGELQRLVSASSGAMLTPAGCAVTLAVWIGLGALCVPGWRVLEEGSPAAASPLLRKDSAHHAAHDRIERRFGGVDSFVVLAEGHDKNALKDPQTLRTIEALQRRLERDPAVGYSVSVADVVRSANALLHDEEPRWGVVPSRWTDVGGLLFAFFGSAPPAETAGIVSGDYRVAPVSFFLRDRSPAALHRVVARAREFIEQNPMDKAAFRLAGGTLGVLAAANEAMPRSAVLVHTLGLAAVASIFLFATRSFAAAFVATLPVATANFALAAFAGVTGAGLGLSSVAAVVLAIGFGAHFPLYMIARIVESYRALEGDYSRDRDADRLRAAALEAMATAGKGIAFSAFVVGAAAAFWTASDVRFHAEIGGLLAMWTAVAAAASLTLVPALIVSTRPAFVERLAAAEPSDAVLAAAPDSERPSEPNRVVIAGVRTVGRLELGSSLKKPVS